MKDINFLKQNGVDINKSLELFGDVVTYNETIREFKNAIDGKLEKIEDYYQDADMPNYAIYVHSLKSDCKYFGFMKLASLAYDHEMKSKAGDLEYVKEHYQELMSEASKVRGIVFEYLDSSDEVKAIYSDEKQEDEGNIILVADDSEVIRVFVKKVFDGEYDIEVARDGKETLDIIREHESDGKIKAILLDLNMPDVDGFAVLDYLKEKDLFKKMPVTIVSGDSSSEAIHRAFTYDIIDMLGKPFSEERIKEVVVRTIRSND